MINVRYVDVAKMAELTGYTKKAIDNKIDSGVWVHGKEWRKAPDGRRLIDVEGYNAWVESMLVSPLKVKRASKSLSNIMDRDAANSSNLNLRLPT